MGAGLAAHDPAGEDRWRGSAKVGIEKGCPHLGTPFLVAGLSDGEGEVSFAPE